MWVSPRGECEAHGLCLPLEVEEHAFAVAFFVVRLAVIDVVVATGQEGVDQPGELVGGRADGLGLAAVRTVASVHAPSDERLFFNVVAAWRSACARRFGIRLLAPESTSRR